MEDPAAAEKRPAPHGSHTRVPLDAAYVPAWQSPHVDDAAIACALPPLHATQTDAPAELVKRPTGQSVHASAPGVPAYVPAEHITQAEEPGAPWAQPTGQSWQLDAPVAFANRPIGQSLQGHNGARASTMRSARSDDAAQLYSRALAAARDAATPVALRRRP